MIQKHLGLDLNMYVHILYYSAISKYILSNIIVKMLMYIIFSDLKKLKMFTISLEKGNIH